MVGAVSSVTQDSWIRQKVTGCLWPALAIYPLSGFNHTLQFSLSFFCLHLLSALCQRQWIWTNIPFYTPFLRTGTVGKLHPLTSTSPSSSQSNSSPAPSLHQSQRHPTWWLYWQHPPRWSPPEKPTANWILRSHLLEKKGRPILLQSYLPSR